VSDLETGKNLDNSTRQPLTGWKLWWRVFMRENLWAPAHYKDSAFPACPACGSPNVVLAGGGKNYVCLERDCKSKGSCEVEGGDGVAQRKAKVRGYVVFVALLIFILVLVLTGNAGPPGAL